MCMMARVLVPRLGFSAPASCIQQAIAESVQELGYDSATPEQEEVVQKFVSGKDVFAGSGKSVCFACISLVYDKLRHLQLKNTQKVSVTIVVSPLSALMQDQVTKFSSKGLKAIYWR